MHFLLNKAAWVSCVYMLRECNWTRFIPFARSHSISMKTAKLCEPILVCLGRLWLSTNMEMFSFMVKNLWWTIQFSSMAGCLYIHVPFLLTISKKTITQKFCDILRLNIRFSPNKNASSSYQCCVSSLLVSPVLAHWDHLPLCLSVTLIVSACFSRWHMFLQTLADISNSAGDSNCCFWQHDFNYQNFGLFSFTPP